MKFSNLKDARGTRGVQQYKTHKRLAFDALFKVILPVQRLCNFAKYIYTFINNLIQHHLSCAYSISMRSSLDFC